MMKLAIAALGLVAVLSHAVSDMDQVVSLDNVAVSTRKGGGAPPAPPPPPPPPAPPAPSEKGKSPAPSEKGKSPAPSEKGKWQAPSKAPSAQPKKKEALELLPPAPSQKKEQKEKGGNGEKTEAAQEMEAAKSKLKSDKELMEEKKEALNNAKNAYDDAHTAYTSSLYALGKLDGSVKNDETMEQYAKRKAFAEDALDAAKKEEADAKAGEAKAIAEVLELRGHNDKAQAAADAWAKKIEEARKNGTLSKEMLAEAAKARGAAAAANSALGDGQNKLDVMKEETRSAAYKRKKIANALS